MLMGARRNFSRGGQNHRHFKSWHDFGAPYQKLRFLRRFRLKYRVSIASAEGASQNFRVICRTAAYDVIFFKFQGGGKCPPCPPCGRPWVCWLNHLNRVNHYVNEIWPHISKELGYIDLWHISLLTCCCLLWIKCLSWITHITCNHSWSSPRPDPEKGQSSRMHRRTYRTPKSRFSTRAATSL